MRNLKLITGMLIMISIASVSCKKKPGTATATGSSNIDPVRQERVDHNKKIFDMASKMGDSYTQLNALYGILADDSTDAAKNMDSIAEIYLKLGMYSSAAKMAEKVLEKNPENEKMNEIKAQMLMGEGKFAEALNIDRKLYDKTKKLKFLFNITMAQMQMENMKDANETLTKIKTDPRYEKDSIDVVDEQTGRIQYVPAPAVMSYVEAMISYSKKDMNGMVSKLKQALEIYPQFNNARRNLQAIMQQSKQQQSQQIPKR